MYRILARTQISINRHGDIAEGYANNMRLFEATGVGALLLTEAAANLPDLFRPGREVITYSSVDELIDRARYFLENAEERIAIAGAGQTRTLAEHTYRRRIPELVSMLESRLR
jgi:spore maturation protein CgeB